MTNPTTHKVADRIAAVLLAFGACCCAQAPARAANPHDACSLLSQSQVSAAMGLAVDPGRRPVESDPLSCNWREQGRPEGRARNVVLYVIDAGKFDSEKVRVSKTGGAQQSGIGDEAYYFRPGRLPLTLTVKKGDVYFRIMARSNADHPSDEQDKAVDKALALDILRNL